MPIKAVFVDMDGTLLNPNHEISDYTADVLRRVKEKKIRFIVATGRPYGEVIATIRRCRLEPDYVITSNGGRIHDGSFNVVREHNIPVELATQLVKMGNSSAASDAPETTDKAEGKLTNTKKKIVTNVYRHTEWLTDEDVPELSGAMHKNLPCTDLGDRLYELTPQDLVGVHQVWYYGETADLVVLNDELTRAFGPQLCWTFSAPNMIDCGPVAVTKGNGVREVADVLGLALEDVACFGDAMNDESMLQIAGKAYIMANAQPSLKDAVEHGEVIESNANDGVAKKLEELFLAS
uniref:Haloacid dehalogenase-like hydrolase-like protein n=1 Tax=Angomonas deanei TaxID=59799 RepID=C6K3T2_9TRYP|nr:haloacid dehalogenase-like hydrolase-like protein [Angomonas deanei]